MKIVKQNNNKINKIRKAWIKKLMQFEKDNINKL